MFQTNRLIIVGGPSAAGKSTLITMIQQSRLPTLCDQLGVDPYTPPLCIEARKLPEIRLSSVEQLIIHYDFIRQSLPEGEYAYLSRLINASNCVVVLTLCTSPDMFTQRISSRIKNAWISLLLKPKPYTAKMLLLLRKRVKLFRNPPDILALYDDWSAYIDKCGVSNHLILDSSNTNITTAKPYSRFEVERLLCTTTVPQKPNNETGLSLRI